ncbi:hypothetical protein CDD82_1666 [Ophiocordyceps australis]|uniref:Exocyst complex protein EXO70 n=1 Tax=Ophiocordyceps australis TaxID=1399860 RepID=A0A2C5Y7I4_9HYPO|nr:hypothetical protein CDD82_1666 [Ophiocordyceps australis]
MAVGLVSSQGIDEEARAEVDVLNSRLDKTAQLTKKIQACLGRLEASGHSVRQVAGPLSGETRRLQLLENNVDAVLDAIGRLRQPVDSKDNEEATVRAGPDKVGLSVYIASVKRLQKSLNGMQASNIRANQHAMAELQHLVGSAKDQLENHFGKILRADTPHSVEPLHYITKSKAFPVLSQDTLSRLALIHTHLLVPDASSSIPALFADIRGPYISSSLFNLAAASVSTAKKKNPGAMYRAGTNGMSTYASAMKGLFVSEYENICAVFGQELSASILHSTCQASLTELARTARELNGHIKAHVSTDCYLAYEVTDILSTLGSRLEPMSGQVKMSISAALKPVRETAKSSLAELLEETRRRINGFSTLPTDGSLIPLVPETMRRLQAMTEFLTPISAIMVSLGHGGWRAGTPSNSRSADTAPTLAAFDIGADGREIFCHYCLDTMDLVLTCLEQKIRQVLRNKYVHGVFLANCVVVMERMVRDSELGSLPNLRLNLLEQWRKKATAMYTDVCKDLSVYLFDTIHTNRSQRPTSGQAADSASVIKGLSSKDKDKIKDKFLQFNAAFDDMVSKHKSYNMEPEVRSMFGEDIRQKLQPLYDRFWDRYHEIDKGKGKYVKYDKAAISAVFLGLSL